MPEPEIDQDRESSTGASRRRFLATAGAGLAVTAVGVGVATGATTANASEHGGDQQGVGTEAETVAAVSGHKVAGPPLVVYVADLNSDRLGIQVGGTEVVVRNRGLVKALDDARKPRRRHSASKEL